MPIGDDIAIPEPILVRCPLVGFIMARARKCNGCEYFRGLSEQLASPGMPFHRAYAVRCSFPTDRELAALEED